MSGPRRWTTLSLFVLAGCAGTDSSSPPSSPDAAAPVVVPTEEEADARAAEQIDDSNADAEFERLMNEIEGGG